jgi:hypothetical protein
MYRLRNVMIMGFYPALFLILAAGAGSMLLDIALPVGAPSGSGIPLLTIIMALALALGAAIAMISLMLSPGFRRWPFWLSLAVAALLLLLAMDLNEWIPLNSTVFSGFGDVPLQDGITVLALAAATDLRPPGAGRFVDTGSALFACDACDDGGDPGGG